jgi:hypothetical protein
MIKCAHCKEQLSAYLDGIMTAEEKKLIEEHLSTCEQCKAALSELMETRETLRNLEEVEPPPWFTQTIMNRVREEAEPRKGLLQRLFYPLHIKIPVEALATCLVVVLALFVYKNTEPEIKAIHEPEETVTASPQNQAQERDGGVASAPRETEGKSDSMLKEDREEQRKTISQVRPENAGAGGIVKNAPSPPGSPARQMPEKSADAIGSRYEAKTGETETLKKQEPMPAQRAAVTPTARPKEDSIAPAVGSAAVKDAQEAMKARSSSQFQAAPAAESKRILFTVSTNSIETTAKETESLLNRFGAKNINRSSRQPRSVTLDADLPGQKVTEFLNALRTIGDLKGKEVPSKSPEEYLAVRIEITGNP